MQPTPETIDTVAVRNVLRSLSPREEKVLAMRVGRDGIPLTLNEIAKDFEVTAARIAEIERKALRKLRVLSTSAQRIWLRLWLDASVDAVAQEQNTTMEDLATEVQRRMLEG